ncbi:MAG: 30S ribosomal protein S12 methylthiotransferase RimO [Deferribacteraceae bacterium]|jgi:ribosomal protein S12 methylthiotransferase|nr:30S ribosomal protein S12 methylthiotransferase RimO [Deferribacteraceae bacterium]
MKIGLISLGCPKNQVDLEHFAGSLPKQAELTVSLEEADLVIINSCGFITEATVETLQTLFETRRTVKNGAKIALVGCLAERYKNEDLSDIVKEADFIAGVDEFDKLFDYMRSIDKRFCKTSRIMGERFLLNPLSYAYLKISEGCGNRCTYCTIPAIRGSHRSFGRKTLLKETYSLAEKGVKEIILIAQDITKYGRDNNSAYFLPDLLEELASSFSQIYFRILYLNPDGISDELIKTVQRCDNIIKYFDIPIQHASDAILRRMGRHYTVSDVKEVLDKIRAAIPDVFIRSTFITGFPGESEDDFNQLADFLSEYKPDYAGFFIYSPEEGTPACKFSGKILKKTARARLKKLQTIQKNNTLNRLRKLRDIHILVDKLNADFDFILDAHALFQTPEIDGITYVLKGRAANGEGVYRARVKRVVYPDIYVELI